MISTVFIIQVLVVSLLFLHCCVGQEHALYVKDDILRENSRERRQTSADQMVQNILQWLQGVYTQQNINRKTRQGTSREYLPPTQTQKPRPFEAVTGSTVINTNAPFAASTGSGGGGNQPYTDIRPPFTGSGYPVQPQPKPPFHEGDVGGTTTGTTAPPTQYHHEEVAVGAKTEHIPTDDAGPTAKPVDVSTISQPVEDNTTGAPTTAEGGSAGPEDDPEKHPPHIHDISVECAKDQMTINLEFNREYNGVVYSKGYYSQPECRYVSENSGQTKYTFTVMLNSCGTEFINAFDTQGQSYLENVLVIQNEPGIQEVWDTIRSVRCLWEGNLKESLSVALSVGMLNQELVTFSGDTAMAKLDVQLGRGPFAQPANGLVKIGETMTLVVSVTGDADFDVNVHDCRATDPEGNNQVALTDEQGCILKPKLFGAFQKTRDTGDTGAAIIAYAYFSAFKFPDVMDLMLECNVELCKTDCTMCTDPNPQYEPGRRRRRRRKRQTMNSTNNEFGVTMAKHLRIILPEDISDVQVFERRFAQDYCFTGRHLVYASGTTVILFTVTVFTTIYYWVKSCRQCKQQNSWQ